ncbi:hypothetical protein F4801DRAFT_529978 [Xylaria longipes]|nr:hypothetical protein F4801DRAFT_529978 [Xylaria longipes]
MPTTFADQQEKRPAPLQGCNIGKASSTQYTNIDSAVDMTFPEAVERDLAKFGNEDNTPEMNSPKISNPLPTHSINHHVASSGSKINSSSPDTPRMSIVAVNGMPYKSERLMEMGAALAQARREKRFPPTITPGYNLKATIDDYEDLERLNGAREGTTDTRDHAFCPDISRLYIQIQRRIQDRDLTHGEVAADANVRARLSGFANSTGAETSMYNLMRHAMNSVLRLNNLTLDSDSNIVDTVVTRVVSEIRGTVQSQVARGMHGVDGVNMDSVMEDIFSAIEHALGDRVENQADRLDANATRVEDHINNMSSITDAHNTQINNMSSITDAHNAQVSVIAGHVNAIDNHVHAMGNNVNAMSSLVNSTNGNVTALTTNVGSLQSIVNMLPQMVTKSVGDILPQAIHGAVEEAFEAAISNELLNRMQTFVNAVQQARAHEGVAHNSNCRTHKKRGWFSKFNILKKRFGRRPTPSSTAY